MTNHERLIKRSRIIEQRLAGNIFSTVAIDKDENIIGCGCNKLFKLPQKGYVSLHSGLVDIFAISNDSSLEYKSLTPFDYELMPYLAFDAVSGMSRYGVKCSCYDDMIVATLYLDGNVKVAGLCEAGEEKASYWTDIADILLFSEGVLGVTKSGNIKLCGSGAREYVEMQNWTNIAYVKKISAGHGGLTSSGFVGLRKDGTLVYCGKDKDFENHIANFKNVVSFDGYAMDEKVKEFYAVLSDGSMHSYLKGTDILPTFDGYHYKKDFLAVKYLPSGPHFIKLDGSIETMPHEEKYPEALKEAFITLTGHKYEIVYEAFRTAGSNPLASQVTGWKLFDDPDEVLRRYEGFETRSFRMNNKCLYCGGDLKGFLGKKCTVCGKKHSL